MKNPKLMFLGEDHKKKKGSKLKFRKDKMNTIPNKRLALERLVLLRRIRIANLRSVKSFTAAMEEESIGIVGESFVLVLVD